MQIPEILLATAIALIGLSITEVVRQFSNGLKLTLGMLLAVAMASAAYWRVATYDTGNYLLIFEQIRDAPFTSLFQGGIHGDIGFHILVAALSLVTDSSALMFFALCLMSTTLHALVLHRLPNFFLAFLVYFSHSFFLKELVQVRAGIASALLLGAGVVITTRIRLALSALAIGTHLGTLLAASAVLFKELAIGRARFVVGLIAIGVPIGYVVSNELVQLGVVLDLPFFRQYVGGEYAQETAVVSNPIFWKQVFLVILVLALSRVSTRQAPVFETLALMISAAILLSFQNIQVAARLASFFAVFEPIVVAGAVSMVQSWSVRLPLLAALLGIYVGQFTLNYARIFSELE